MNRIEKTITSDDVLANLGEKKSPKTIASDILSSLETACPYGLTFVDGIPEKNKAKVEAELKKRFELWANSWIAPKCRRIIAKAK